MAFIEMMRKSFRRD